MPSPQRVLQALTEHGGRPAARTRPALIQRVLETALLMVEGRGAVVQATRGRRIERYWLRRGMREVEAIEDPPGGTEFLRLLGRGGAPVMVADVEKDGHLTAEDRCPGVAGGPALFVPLRQREQLWGSLAVYRGRGERPFGPKDIGLVSLLAAWTSLAFENLRLSESLERLAVTDDLTQVYNFRYLKSALRREIKRAGRYRQDLSLVMIDVDNLKGYNDRFGHLRGSSLLKEIAARFLAQVRSFDIIAKYGGDEVTLILPQTEREGARIVAERMRESIANHGFPLAEAGKITISLGVATYPHDAADAHGLIQAADRALYRAKKAGRNRVATTMDRAA